MVTFVQEKCVNKKEYLKKLEKKWGNEEGSSCVSVVLPANFCPKREMQKQRESHGKKTKTNLPS